MPEDALGKVHPHELHPGLFLRIQCSLSQLLQAFVVCFGRVDQELFSVLTPTCLQHFQPGHSLILLKPEPVLNVCNAAVSLAYLSP